MEEISNASLFIDDNFIITLDYPKLKNVDGVVLLECYIINKNHGYNDDIVYFKELKEKIYYNQLKIKTITKHGSEIILKNVYLKSCTFPSFEFEFICTDHYVEYLLCNENVKIENFFLSSLLIEGLDLQFTKTSEINRKRIMFGIDDSRTLSLKLDNTELFFQYFDKKRQYDLKIGIIDNQEESNSIILKFYGDSIIPYKIYLFFKNSIKFFLSYIAGNNIIIREETFTINHTNYISKIYSINKLTDLNNNKFLPIFDSQFRHDRILQDYINTLPNYLFLDKLLNLSEVIYLINQSKKVNIESSFFILLIAIEKLSYNLTKSRLIESKNNFIIDNELFIKLKPILKDKIEEVFDDKISKNEIKSLKTKIDNLNIKNKTDNKIDILLDFCEIKRNEKIDLLFPKLRNLAIHEGEISFSENDAFENHQTLSILINSILCNLIQYKGIRFIEHKNDTNYISKKEQFVNTYVYNLKK